jgi:hypothetical protein
MHGASGLAAAVLLAVSPLAACTGSSSGGGSGGMIVDVHGTVVFDGAPVSSVTVGIPGAGTTTTAADGTFALTGVTVPYAVAVASPSGAGATFYQGLRSAAPILPLGWVPGPTWEATVSGTIAGGEAYPQPAGHDTVTCLDYDGSLGQPGGDGQSAGADPAAFSAKVAWWGTSTVSTRLRGVQRVLDGTSGLPTAYLGYGESDPLTLTTAGLAEQLLSLEPVSVATLTGTVAVPEGYTLHRRALGLGCLWLVKESTTTAGFSYPTPALGGTALTVVAEARTPASAIPGARGASATAVRTGLAPDASAVAVTLPAAPTLLEPEDLTSGVSPGARFSWSGRSGALHYLIVQVLGADTPFLVVITPDATALLPDPALVGVPFPHDATVTWRAASLSPRTIAEVVATGRLGPPGDSLQAVSETRFLQTAP